MKQWWKEMRSQYGGCRFVVDAQTEEAGLGAESVSQEPGAVSARAILVAQWDLWAVVLNQGVSRPLNEPTRQ